MSPAQRDTLETLDTRGLLCPLPVIRTQDRIRTMSSGERLEVVATDPGALHDIPAWCRVHGHELVEASESDDLIRIVIRVVSG